MKNKRGIIKTLLLAGILVMTCHIMTCHIMSSHMVRVNAAQPESGADMEQERTDLADGEYSIEVTLSGGSGRATVVSPAAMTVADGMATARIEWSSPNYDYMLVNGEKYLPINSEGNSVFSIPVLCFDSEMQVTADTTAMSVPHEIEYTLVFDGASAAVLSSEAADTAAEGFDLRLMFLIVLAVMSAAAVAAYAQYKR